MRSGCVTRRGDVLSTCMRILLCRLRLAPRMFQRQSDESAVAAARPPSVLRVRSGQPRHALHIG